MRPHPHRADAPESYVLSILNATGQEIETISLEPLTARAFGVQPDESAYKNLRELFERARRRALGTEQAIHAILQELNS